MSLKGHFIASSKGRVFITQFGDNKSGTAVLCLPSITEELNLARAVLAKQCQSFAENSIDSFILDYTGTGDSEGEFEEYTADDWLQDIIAAGKWLLEQGYKKLVLLGVRMGGLFLVAHQELLHQSLPISGQILWKPVTNGKLFINQLIRIKQASQLMGNATQKVNWRNEILAGNSTEIAGYLLTKAMVEGIEQLAITKESDWQVPTYWLELASETITPATKRLTENVKNIITQPLKTPAFWQVPEVFNLPQLNQQGLIALKELKSQ
ncbi:serine aminopeptidase domain-containing protein [Thalassotalea atypica]|uniref:serine aminopeptidase domain-containing protein n=1 Tax=Thalassotalea atypica TaxID=2054316 RepID=UPI00257267A7|nr:alpha/beta hydrolase [Thalassotalea atypica]